MVWVARNFVTASARDCRLPTPTSWHRARARMQRRSVNELSASKVSSPGAANVLALMWPSRHCHGLFTRDGFGDLAVAVQSIKTLACNPPASYSKRPDLMLSTPGKSHVFLKCTLPNSRRVFSFSTMLSRCHSFSSDYILILRKARMINYVCEGEEAILLLERRAKRLVNLKLHDMSWERHFSCNAACYIYRERGNNCTYCFRYFFLYKTSLAFTWISHLYTQPYTPLLFFKRKMGGNRENSSCPRCLTSFTVALHLLSTHHRFACNIIAFPDIGHLYNLQTHPFGDNDIVG